MILRVEFRLICFKVLEIGPSDKPQLVDSQHSNLFQVCWTIVQCNYILTLCAFVDSRYQFVSTNCTFITEGSVYKSTSDFNSARTIKFVCSKLFL